MKTNLEKIKKKSLFFDNIDYSRRKISNSLYFINRAKSLLTTMKMLYHLFNK